MNFNVMVFLQQCVVMFLWILLAAGAYALLERRRTSHGRPCLFTVSGLSISNPPTASKAGRSAGFCRVYRTVSHD
jgi:hypothetical protein